MSLKKSDNTYTPGELNIASKKPVDNFEAANLDLSLIDGFDIDAEAFLLGSNGKVINETDFVFYNNSLHDSKSIEHLGEKTADSVNEQFRVTVDKIPPTVAKVVFTITLHEAAQRKQTFGQVQDIFIKLADEKSGKEILRYDFGKNFFRRPQ